MIYVDWEALRLARFNTQVATADNRFFSGLPSPPAAALVASMVWMCVDNDLQGFELPFAISVVAGVVTAVAGVLMVTYIPYLSFMVVDFKGRVPFVMALLIPLLIAVVFVDPPLVLLAMASTYAVSGPIGKMWSTLR